MMQSSSSLLCSSNSLSPPLPLSIPQQLLPFPNRFVNSVASTSFVRQIPFTCSRIHRRSLSAVKSTATQEVAETSWIESDFVEIGSICGVHGLQGEVRVKGSTDFPELRFSMPGRRWLKQRVSGRQMLQEVELVEGRGHPGQKGWIVKFSDVDTVEQAQQLIGSTMLITEDSRPELEEGELYTRDLVGMRVILKESGKPVGTVVNVFDSGASDLLQVRLNSTAEMPDGVGMEKSGISASDPLVWVPFVEAIVPNVDISKREMLITPPKGLLELNLRSDERSKKERRQLEWKERKKYQKRLIAAKKKLCEMEQQHVFHGFRFGEKAQGSLLADQILSVNSKLLQSVLQNTEIPSKRWNLSEFIKSNLTEQMKTTAGSGGMLNASSRLQQKSQLLTSEGKVAIVLVVDAGKDLESESDTNLLLSERTEDSLCVLLQTLLSDNERLVKVEDRKSVPLILVSSAHAIGSLQSSFAKKDHFAFDSKKVWFLEEEKLPVISSIDEPNKHKILMKSPWEVLQTPIGSGGVISLLSAHDIMENLGEEGVEYIEVRGVGQKHGGGQTLLGLVNSREAHVGIQISKDADDFEEDLHMIFSMTFMQQLTKQLGKLQFEAIAKPNPHVEKVDKEWVNVNPSSPNSYEFRSSILSSLKACPSDKVCLMEVTE
ncbi:hypothetical protein RJ639_020911 [Escallonia herrerae]|uniref:Uncharacterized protein n=1 Tax=Escallonia herrerae TaxID=1293975 RepID=A0AA89AH74_9ASTE|nr:hypothetical protein RJ639_020911 [Escallonia herrerae]